MVQVMKSQLRTISVWGAYRTASALAAVALIAAWGMVGYGSVFAIPAIAQGQVVLARPATKPMGTLVAGRRYEAEFELINLASRSVMINGIRASCACVFADNLPVQVPAGGHLPVRLWVQPRAAQVGQSFAQSVDLILSVPGSRTTLTVVGTVAGDGSSD